MNNNNNRNYNDERNYGPFFSWVNWGANFPIEQYEKKQSSYDFLIDYAKVYNFFTARTSQPNPFSNKAMFLMNMLSRLGVKHSTDIFTYEGNDLFWGSTDHDHKLVNIIVEPNPEATGPALVFCAHHDVANTMAQNCQDNGASVCNLLKLASMISQSKESHQRVIILFSDCEEFGAKGARRFAKQSTKIKDSNNIKHKLYGEISGVVNLELTGLGKEIWSDCKNLKQDITLHAQLEKAFKKTIHKLSTPPSDAIAFREFFFPTVCIGILPENELQSKKTWHLCHSQEDTITKCSRQDMEDFTNFLFELTKTNQHTTAYDNESSGTNKAAGALQT